MDTIYVKDALAIKFEGEADIEDFTYHLIAKASGHSYQQILEMPVDEFAVLQKEFNQDIGRPSEMEDAGRVGYWVNLIHPLGTKERLLVRRPLVKEMRSSNRHRNGRVYGGKLLIAEIAQDEEGFPVPFSDIDLMAWVDFNNILELVNFYNEGN